jgi:hypothetical protein
MKKVALWLINCALFNSFSVCKNLNPRMKLRYKEFLLRVAKAWSTEQMEAAQAESDTDLVRPGLSTPTLLRPHVEPPGRLSGDMRKHVLAQIVKREKGKRKYPRPCLVCALHKKRSKTRYICEFCVVPLHKGKCFQRYNSHAFLGALVSFY